MAATKKTVGILKTAYVLHGWAYSAERWEAFSRRMGERGFRVKVLPVPGLTAPSDRAWTLDEYVHWLDGQLSGERTPLLVGHSNGGRIAIAFAASHPARLARLALIDSAGIYHNELWLRVKRAVFRAAAKLGKRLTTSETLRRMLYRIAGAHDYRDAPPHMRQTMLNLITRDLTHELASLTVPTLIVWGERDAETPLADGKTMHSLIARSELFIVPSARHAPQFTHADVVADRVARFFSRP